jgi:hypothetical protein
MKELRELMYTHIHGYNKYLTRDHLEKLSMYELLANCHPVERVDFTRKLENLSLKLNEPNNR